jgi:hypothetical protein
MTYLLGTTNNIMTVFLGLVKMILLGISCNLFGHQGNFKLSRKYPCSILSVLDLSIMMKSYTTSVYSSGTTKFSERLVCLNLSNSVSADLFVNILLHLPLIQNLKVNTHDMSGGNVNTITAPASSSSRIKELDVKLVISAPRGNSSNSKIMDDKLNNFFQLLVNVCPLIEEFKLGGQLYDRQRNCYNMVLPSDCILINFTQG